MTLQGNSDMNLKINTYGQCEEWMRSRIQGNLHPSTVAHSSKTLPPTPQNVPKSL